MTTEEVIERDPELQRKLLRTQIISQRVLRVMRDIVNEEDLHRVELGLSGRV